MISSWCIANEVLLYFEISTKCPTDVSDAFQLIVNSAFNHKHNKFKRIINEETEILNRQKTRRCCCGFFSCFVLCFT